MTAPPPPDPHEPIRALLRAGKYDEAIVKLCAIGVTRPDDLVAAEMLFDAFFHKRDWEPALALANNLADRRPDMPRLQKALIATLSNMKRFDETIAQARSYIERHGEDLVMLDALKVGHVLYRQDGCGDPRTASARSNCATPRRPACRKTMPL